MKGRSMPVKNVNINQQNVVISRGINKNIHEGVKYACDKCDNKATRGALKRHQQSVHEGVKYACNKCYYNATTRGPLKSHQQSVHEGVKYACDKCEYKATKRSDLKVHQ